MCIGSPKLLRVKFPDRLLQGSISLQLYHYKINMKRIRYVDTLLHLGEGVPRTCTAEHIQQVLSSAQSLHKPTVVQPAVIVTHVRV